MQWMLSKAARQGTGNNPLYPPYLKGEIIGRTKLLPSRSNLGGDGIAAPSARTDPHDVVPSLSKGEGIGAQAAVGRHFICRHR